MNYDIYKPHSSLTTIVKQYVVITDAKNIETMLFLPNGGSFLIFNRGASSSSQLHTGEVYSIPECYSVGMKLSKAKKIILNCSLDVKESLFPIILVELQAIGFYKLFHADASILTQGHMSLNDEIVKGYFSQLYKHEDILNEISYLDEALMQMNKANNNSRLLIEDVIDSIIHKHYFEVTIEELMLEFNYTRRTLERQFKKMIGLSPKNFIYILKFCKTFLKYIEETKTFNEIEYLYNDNAHFNVVFQKITGYSPSELLNDVVKTKKIQIYQMKQIA